MWETVAWSWNRTIFGILCLTVIMRHVCPVTGSLRQRSGGGTADKVRGTYSIIYFGITNSLRDLDPTILSRGTNLSRDPATTRA